MIKVVSNEVMKKSDKCEIEKIGAKELLFKAGKSIYDSYDFKGKVGIVCGSGNNAGDGYVLGSLLENAFVLRTTDKATTEAQYFLDKCKNVIFIDETYDFTDYDIIVDCLFGTGLNRELDEKYKKIIENINKSNAKKISVDINSGLNGNNGLANIAVNSDLTISIGYYKYGHFLNDAKTYIKELINNNIDIPLKGKNVLLLEEKDVKELFKKRKQNTNKKSFGYTAIIGGSKEFSGAVKLSNLAYSALRSGCGIAKLLIPKSIENSVLPYMLESILVSIDDIDGKMIFSDEFTKLNNIDSISIGMGMGESREYEKIIKYLIENYNVPIIIDADGINTLAKMDLNILKENVILTPHLKEFSRLINKSIKEIKENLIEEAIKFSKKYNCTLLLKGPTTIVTNGNITYLINKGNAGMSTAGSGDVLSGILSGLLAYNNDYTFTAACGAYINGLAGDLGKEEKTEISLIARDTIINIPAAIKQIIS